MGSHGIVLAENMDTMGGGAAPMGGSGPPRLTLPSGRASMSDASGGMVMAAARAWEKRRQRWAAARCRAGGVPSATTPEVPGQAFVPLGEIADIRIAGGPPMVRDEAGLLVGYVYVDIDQASRDIGGYVNEAKEVVARAMADGTLKLPAGTYLKWTGQYEQLEEMAARMKLVVRSRSSSS